MKEWVKQRAAIIDRSAPHRGHIFEVYQAMLTSIFAAPVESYAVSVALEGTLSAYNARGAFGRSLPFSSTSFMIVIYMPPLFLQRRSPPDEPGSMSLRVPLFDSACVLNVDERTIEGAGGGNGRNGAGIE